MERDGLRVHNVANISTHSWNSGSLHLQVNGCQAPPGAVCLQAASSALRAFADRDVLQLESVTLLSTSGMKRGNDANILTSAIHTE